jgi:DNA-binding NtrC family response regulator
MHPKDMPVVFFGLSERSECHGCRDTAQAAQPQQNFWTTKTTTTKHQAYSSTTQVKLHIESSENLKSNEIRKATAKKKKKKKEEGRRAGVARSCMTLKLQNLKLKRGPARP